MNRGYFGIGIWKPKHEVNAGTLWRSAYNFGAAYCFTIGRRFKEQASDTVKAWRSVPMFNYQTLDDLMEHLPHGCPLIGVELNDRSRPLDRFVHPDRCVYLLGAEDHGLSDEVMDRCHHLIQVPGLRGCLNVSVTGSIVLYDRQIQKVGSKTALRKEGVLT